MIKNSLQLVRNMGARYTLYRVRHELEKRTGVLKKRHPVNPPLKNFISLSDWRANTPAFLIPERELLTIPKIESDLLKEQANRILRGDVLFFSHEWKELGEVYIGNNFHSGFGCLILTGNHNYKGNKLPYDEVTVYKKVVIEDNVWLGIKVVILPGVTIGEGAIIQACSVVVSDIPKYSIAGGNPATPFLKRNLNHYNELKKKKCFI